MSDRYVNVYRDHVRGAVQSSDRPAGRGEMSVSVYGALVFTKP